MLIHSALILATAFWSHQVPAPGEHWDTRSACGTPVVRVVDLPEGVSGRGWPLTCVIELDRDRLRVGWKATQTITHELGHILNYSYNRSEHSPDPNSVMYAAAPTTPKFPFKW